MHDILSFLDSITHHCMGLLRYVNIIILVFNFNFIILQQVTFSKTNVMKTTTKSGKFSFSFSGNNPTSSVF